MGYCHVLEFVYPLCNVELTGYSLWMKLWSMNHCSTLHYLPSLLCLMVEVGSCHLYKANYQEEG